MAVPIPKVTRESMAKRCWRTKTMTRMAVKARNPGTSRRLCNRPISSPVKAARSTTKLLSITCQVTNAIVLPMARRYKRVLRLCNTGYFMAWFLMTNHFRIERIASRVWIRWL